MPRRCLISVAVACQVVTFHYSLQWGHFFLPLSLHLIDSFLLCILRDSGYSFDVLHFSMSFHQLCPQLSQIILGCLKHCILSFQVLWKVLLFPFSLIKNKFNLKSIHSCYDKEQCSNKGREGSADITASTYNNWTNVSRYLWGTLFLEFICPCLLFDFYLKSDSFFADAATNQTV